jgi:glycosyltransferase involved in cell wall biosynthesis
VSSTDPNAIVVVIPALNEERAIRGVVESVLAICPNVILVDDGSTDATLDRIRDLPITVIHHEQPRGKGEALRAGFGKALALGFDAVVTMDGDGQHVAEDIPRMLAAARQYPEHIVIAARMIGRECQPARRRWANDFADWGIGWGVGQRLIDTQSGQRYYPRAVLVLADVATRHGFVFETEILMEANWRNGTRVVAIPILARYHGSFRASHFRDVPDFLRITRRVIWKIIRRGGLWRNYLRSRRIPALIVDPPGN